MAELISPTPWVHASYLNAIAEYAQLLSDGAHHEPREYSYLDNRFTDGDAAWLIDPANFETFTQRLRADAEPDAPRPEGWCPATHLWFVDGDEYIGTLDIRHDMTDFLFNTGGIIGYDIRPSMRGRGYGKHMLNLALPVAKSLGHDPVLITCDPGNEASVAVITANGGALEDERNHKLRFWVPTSVESKP